MRVAVIGAGISGLAAAREIVKQGGKAVVFESAGHVGGRVDTVSFDGFTFDPGATTLMPMGRPLESVVLNELSQDGLVRVEKPVMAHDGFRAHAGGLSPTRAARYCYSQGIAELPRRMAATLDVRLNTSIDEIETVGSTHRVAGEDFDAVVVSLPAPLAEPLLVSAGERRSFNNVRYRPCLSVLLGYKESFDPPYHALVGPDQTHPLSWLSIESVKCPGSRAPEGQTAMVAQMGGEYSRRRFRSDDDLVLEEAIGDVSRILGDRFECPVASRIVRYAYSQPETTTMFESVNSPMSTIVVAGDSLMGGRTELAYESGLKAAKIVIGRP